MAPLTQGTIVANLGFSDIAFARPRFHGPILTASAVRVSLTKVQGAWLISSFDPV